MRDFLNLNFNVGKLTKLHLIKYTLLLHQKSIEKKNVVILKKLARFLKKRVYQFEKLVGKNIA